MQKVLGHVMKPKVLINYFFLKRVVDSRIPCILISNRHLFVNLMLLTALEYGQIRSASLPSVQRLISIR